MGLLSPEERAQQMNRSDHWAQRTKAMQDEAYQQALANISLGVEQQLMAYPVRLHKIQELLVTQPW